MSAMPAKRVSTRAMRSPVNWALLGLVIERSSYGLELFHRFERMYGQALPLSGESHIYAALDQLEQRGFTERIGVSARARQPKPRYRATQSGQSSYEDWLVDQMAAARSREELWIRQLGVFAHDPNAALHLLGRFECEHLKTAGQAARSPDATIDSRADLMDDLVAERQRLAYGEMLSWLQYAQDRFEARLTGAVVDEPAPG
jgi:DNA-binding PadR family transcriptional regulator